MILTSRYRYWSRPFAFVLVYVFRKSFNCSCLVTHNYGYLSFTSSYPCRVQRARLHWSPFLQRNKSKNPTKSPGQDLVYAETGQTIHTSKRRNKSEGSTTTTKLVKANIKKPNSNVDWQSEDHLIEKEDASQDPCQSVQIEDEKESEDVEPAPSEKKTSKKKTKKKEPEPVVPEYAIEDFFEHNDSIHEDMRYGTCKLCSAPIVIPGLDHYLCKECGWISNSDQSNEI